MSRILSHPNLDLAEHIDRVRKAMQAILARHGCPWADEGARLLLFKMAALHDLGKACAAFQEYIRSPVDWHGNPKEKAHAPLSMMLCLLQSQNAGESALFALALAACVAGHHKGLPYLPATDWTDSVAEKSDLADLLDHSWRTILKQQIAGFPLDGILAITKEEGCFPLLTDKSVRQARKYLLNCLVPAIYALNLQDRVDFRLWAQFLFSVLLEADKLFLAVSDPLSLLPESPARWDSAWVERKIGSPKPGSVNKLRAQARQRLKCNMGKAGEENIFTLTAPTGLGKTLLSATWALEERAKAQRQGKTAPKIIVVLPFLSIIDQTAGEYEALLKIGGCSLPDGFALLKCHSLSERSVLQGMEETDESFFVDTWRSDVIITTYDQFLMAMLENASRHQMRFHNLCDALIIMDEVQSIPCRLWRLLDESFQTLAQKGGSKILLMSATMPSFISRAFPLLDDYKSYFTAFDRYEISFPSQKQVLKDFLQEIAAQAPGWASGGQRVLVTMNTRRSAREVFKALKSSLSGHLVDVPLFFITSDVTPKDRLERIEKIRSCGPCVVVSTQCIEAGVDLDMDFVIRDFAPWDSIVQIAGRCNREGKRQERGKVLVVYLQNERGRAYAEMIYDPVALGATWELIDDRTLIIESDVLELSQAYFNILDERKDQGQAILDAFSKWMPHESVRKILRGEQQDKIEFVVLEQDPQLKQEMVRIQAIEDRWKRREAWKRIAGRIAKVSVSVFARGGFRPEGYAFLHAGRWMLRTGFYDSEMGLVLDDDDSQSPSATKVF